MFHSLLSSGEVGNTSGEIIVLDFKSVLNWEYYGGLQSTIFHENMLAPPSHETPGCPQRTLVPPSHETPGFSSSVLALF